MRIQYICAKQNVRPAPNKAPRLQVSGFGFFGSGGGLLFWEVSNASTTHEFEHVKGCAGSVVGKGFVAKVIQWENRQNNGGFSNKTCLIPEGYYLKNM